MLSSNFNRCTSDYKINIDPRWERNLKEDLKSAIDLLCTFKEGLDKLHPECTAIIEMILQKPKPF